MFKKIILSVFAAFVLAAVFAVAFIFINNHPVSSHPSDKIFTINSGQGIKSIAQKLEDSRLIRNKYVFIFYSYRLGLSKKIQAGNFKLDQNLSTKDLAVKLTAGGITDYWIKIPEGSRIEELSSLFPEDISFAPSDFLTAVKAKEGYIFPDSYLIPRYFTVDQILTVIQTNFDQKFSRVKEGSVSVLSDTDALVLASILEREGKSLASKQMIAGILLNRLEINMALQVDAAVQYARDSQNKSIDKYWQPLAPGQTKQVISSYNTYLYPGLPPRPICNPGYDSIYAAFHPTESDYLYYITGNDGIMYYAKTLSEHNSNISNYLK